MGTTRVAMVAALVVLSAACSDAAEDPVPIETSTTVAVGPDGPPPLVIDTGGSTVETDGFNYCWNPGGCADSFGAEVPTPIDVDAQSVLVSWVEDGVLSASYRSDDEASFARLSLESVGPGRWSLAMPPEPGTHRIDLSGETEDGTTSFAVLASTSIAGPPLLPIATVWLPDTDDAFLAGADFYGIDADSEARIEIVSSDGISTVLDMQLYVISQEQSECVRWVESESTPVNGVDALGTAPFQATLFLRSGTEQYEMSWDWPQDVGPEGYLTRTMRLSPPVDADDP